MKKNVLFFSILMLVNFLFAQKLAVTDTGEEVILNTDGTWEYKKGSFQLSKNKESKILLNKTEFTKSKLSTFSIKSKKTDNAFYINPQKWEFGPSKDNPDAEYQLRLKGEDLYSMIITEAIEVDLLSLRNVAITNAQKVAPDIKVVNEEYRMVNNRKVLLIEMKGTYNGIKVAYYSYYFSDASGSVQFITYTAQNLLQKYKEHCDDLLNGFAELQL